MSRVTELHVNGSRVMIDIAADRSLLGVLREDLDLTGAKIGCGEGTCGACTVLVDDTPVRSCTIAVGAVAGKAIRTIEGLAEQGRLHPLQQAFLDADALQCGYCTPGMIMNALGLLIQSPDPDETEIIGAMQGNICRCGTYGRIVSAIKQAAASRSTDIRGGAE
jgi:aerobic-type carbon monoxide dehydrogenase small subunit (CoxS/CutS family)